MPTLTEFLLARIAEDEAELGAPFGQDEGAGPNGMGWTEVGAISEVLIISHARALADCAAKRRIVAKAVGWGAEYPDFDGGYQSGFEDACADLATVYKDHPDYDPTWRP